MSRSRITGSFDDSFDQLEIHATGDLAIRFGQSMERTVEELDLVVVGNGDISGFLEGGIESGLAQRHADPTSRVRQPRSDRSSSISTGDRLKKHPGSKQVPTGRHGDFQFPVRTPIELGGPSSTWPGSTCPPQELDLNQAVSSQSIQVIRSGLARYANRRRRLVPSYGLGRPRNEFVQGHPGGIGERPEYSRFANSIALHASRFRHWPDLRHGPIL